MKPYMVLGRHLFRSYFSSPGIWLFTGCLWFFMSFIFSLLIEQTAQAHLGTSIWWCAFLSIPLAPMLSMNLFHKKEGDSFFVLLRTLRLNPYWLAILYFIALMAIFLLFDLILVLQYVAISQLGEPDLTMHLSAGAGLLLLQACYLSCSLFFAGLTKSNMQAFFFSVLFFFFSWMLFYSEYLFSGFYPQIGIFLKEASFYKHFFKFYMGSVQLHDIVTLILVPVFMIYITGVILKK